MVMTFVDKYPTDYVPTIWDETENQMLCEGVNVSLTISDCATGQDYAYDQAQFRFAAFEVQMALICYSVVNPLSLEYLPLHVAVLNAINPAAPFFVVGLKNDLIKDKEAVERMSGKIVPVKDGIAMARKIEACNFFQVSSLSGSGLQVVFEEVCKVVLIENGKRRKQRKKWGFLPKRSNSKIRTVKEYREWNMRNVSNPSFMKEREKRDKAVKGEELMHLRDELEAEKKLALSFQKDFARLPRDIICHILAEWHNLSLEVDCRCFLRRFARRVTELGLKSGSVLTTFFGYFSDDPGRRILQLFYTFTCLTYGSMKKHLPIMKREVTILGWRHGTYDSVCILFQDYYRREKHQKLVRIVSFDGMRFLRDCKGWSKKRSSCVVDINVLWPHESTLLYVLNSKYPMLSSLRIFVDSISRHMNYGDADFEFAKLRSLVLHALPLSDKWTFAKLPNLEEFAVIVPPSHVCGQLLLSQVTVLMKLPKLRKFTCAHVDLGYIQDDFDLLFGNDRIESILLKNCPFDADKVFSEGFSLSSSLQVLAMSGLEWLSERSGGFSPRLIVPICEMASTNPHFRYFMASKARGSMTNMDLGEKKQVVFEIGSHEPPMVFELPSGSKKEKEQKSSDIRMEFRAVQL